MVGMGSEPVVFAAVATRQGLALAWTHGCAAVTKSHVGRDFFRVGAMLLHAHEAVVPVHLEDPATFQNLKIIQSTKPNLKVRHISNLPPVQKYSVRELQRLHKQFTRDTERKRMQLFYNNIASEGDAHLFCEEFGFRVSFADF